VSHRTHLLEERLFDCYLAARNGEALTPPVAEHLADCEACALRYSELASLMDGLTAEATAEADAIFNLDRLRVQQQQIARRLEHVGQPARVISFPSRFVRRTMTATSARPAPRWVAAGAAAGLFIGVVLGATYQFGAHGVPSARQTSAPLLAPVATRGDAPAHVASDDAFLSDLEIALEHPRTRELLAFDALTPHVREIKR
jgi:predicted anti-sigma-YlaC factor YlaD